MSRSGPITKDTSTIALGMAQIRIGNSAANIATVDQALTSANSIGSLGQSNIMANAEYWTHESGFPLQEDLVLPLREKAMAEITFEEITAYNFALARGLDPGAAQTATASIVKVNSTAGTVAAVSPDAADTIDGRFTIVIDAFTSLSDMDISVYEEDLGLVEQFTTFDSTSTDLNPDSAGDTYFTIASGDFGGTFVAGDSIVIRTTPYVAADAGYSSVDSGEIKLGTLQAPAYVRMEAVYRFPNNTREMVVIFPRAQVTSSLEVALQKEDAAVPPMTISAKTADSETSGGHANWDDKPLGRIFFQVVS